jgi:hypothetical protein
MAAERGAGTEGTGRDARGSASARARAVRGRGAFAPNRNLPWRAGASRGRSGGPGGRTNAPRAAGGAGHTTCRDGGCTLPRPSSPLAIPPPLPFPGTRRRGSPPPACGRRREWARAAERTRRRRLRAAFRRDLLATPPLRLDAEGAVRVHACGVHCRHGTPRNPSLSRHAPVRGRPAVRAAARSFARVQFGACFSGSARSLRMTRGGQGRPGEEANDGSDDRRQPEMRNPRLQAIPYSLFPIPYSLFPIPYSLFPEPFVRSPPQRVRHLPRGFLCARLEHTAAE